MSDLLIVGLATAGAPTVAIIVTHILGGRGRSEVAEKVESVKIAAASAVVTTDRKLDQIHVLVNARLEEALEKIASLEALLKKTQEGT